MIQDKYSRPLHDLRISVIDRCNFRCPYCMPSEQFHHHYQFLPEKEWLSFQEIERLVRITVPLGVRKLRLTGGEPLLRPKLDELVSMLSSIPGIEDIALTTNGMLLRTWAKRLRSAGLKRLTVSLDTIDPELFNVLSGGHGKLSDVLTGIEEAVSAGFSELKINAVIMRGVNDAGILDLARHFRGTGHILRFIEFMDVGNQNNWDLNNVVMSDEIIKLVAGQFPIKRLFGTEQGGTAARYEYQDGGGQIEFISSVSHAFCGTCHRLRLSADGKLYTCLFAADGFDIRDSLRNHSSDHTIKEKVQAVWHSRSDRYSQDRAHQRKEHMHPKVEMFRIGG